VASLKWVAANHRTVLAAHIALQFVDGRRFRTVSDNTSVISAFDKLLSSKTDQKFDGTFGSKPTAARLQRYPHNFTAQSECRPTSHSFTSGISFPVDRVSGPTSE
jgi:hypothetical protein